MPKFMPEHTPTELDLFASCYLDAAEWLLDEEIDRDTVKGWAPAAVQRAKDDCASFQESAATLLAVAYARDGYGGDEQAGHDFWLTRNGHGAGFWDRTALEADELGDKLSTIACAFGSVDAYQGDDGFLYLS